MYLPAVSAEPGRDGSVQVTNDGATILKSVGVDNPAAKVLVGIKKSKFNNNNLSLRGKFMKFYFTEIALVQDNEVGDGTTSVTVFASELLKVKLFFLLVFLKKM